MSMKRVRLVVVASAVFVAVLFAFSAPLLSVLGNIVGPLTKVTIRKSVTPNIVVNGDVVQYTITVANEGRLEQDVVVRDDIGNGNRQYLNGTAGGRLTLISGSDTVSGIENRSVQGSIGSNTGLELRKVYPGQVVTIMYRALASDDNVSSVGFSSVPNMTRLDNGSVATAGLRILGGNVTNSEIACSSPADGSFPDPSTEAELRCYENNLVDQGRVSGPVARPAEVAPVLSTELQTCSYSATRDFTDVKVGSDLQCAISFVHDMGLMNGYADRTFRPQRAITRGEFLKVIMLAARMSTASYTASTSRYKDVASSNQFKQYIDAATAYGIVSGYPDGTFRPSDMIHRDEATKIALRAFALATLDTLPDKARFADVSPSDPLAAYVGTAAVLGAVEGRGGYFYPDSGVTRAEVAKIVAKLIGFLANGTSVHAG